MSNDDNSLATRTQYVLDTAQHLVCDSAENYQIVCGFLQGVVGLKKQIDDTFDPIINKAHQAHKEAIAQKKRLYAPLELAESQAKQIVSVYLAEEERKRRELEEKLREEQRLLMAIEADSRGDTAGSEAILAGESPVGLTGVAVVPTGVPSVQGISSRRSYKFRIVDQSRIPREYLTPDTIKIGNVVRALKDQTRIPGIEVYAEDAVVVRRG